MSSQFLDGKFFDCRIRFDSNISTKKKWLSLLGRIELAPSRGTPDLTVRFVQHLASATRKYNSASLVRGHGFALHTENKLLLYPINADRLHTYKNCGTIHVLLQRTIVFALALLDELNGPPKHKHTFLYIHASAVATPRGALVFCGKSTFGKSTIANKLLCDYPELDDDEVMLYVKPNGKGASVAVFEHNAARLLLKQRFPMRGRSVPVAGIFWLKKGSRNSFELIRTADAVSLLLFPLAGWKQPHAVKNRMQILQSLFRAVPCKRLEFKKDKKSLIEFLRLHGYI